MNLTLLREEAAYRNLLSQIANTLTRMDKAQADLDAAAEELDRLILQAKEFERRPPRAP